MSKIHSVVEFRISSHAYAAADILSCLLIFIMSMTGYGTQRENRRKKRTQHPVQTQKFRLHGAPAICLLIANRVERVTLSEMNLNRNCFVIRRNVHLPASMSFNVLIS